MSTKLGIRGPGAESQNSRAPCSPCPQSLVADFPREARLQVSSLEDRCITGLPRWCPINAHAGHEARGPEPGSPLVTQSHWRLLWPPHSSFSSVLDSSLRLPPSGGTASPFLTPHKTLLAGLCLSCSHSNPPHTCGQSGCLKSSSDRPSLCTRLHRERTGSRVLLAHPASS